LFDSSSGRQKGIFSETWVGVEIQKRITDLQSSRKNISVAVIVLRMAEAKAKDATYAPYKGFLTE
jgi:hypothetical protein